jgi:predicted amidophosphoribosyltransferase
VKHAESAFCLSCGKSLPPGSKFCNECGTKQSREVGNVQ